MDVQNQEITSHLPMLPFELIIEILSRVPAKPLVRLKCICKSWNDLINTPNFIKLNVTLSLKANSNKTLIFLSKSTFYTLHLEGPHCHATKLYDPDYFKYHQTDGLVGSCNGLLCFIAGYKVSLYNPLTRFHKRIPRFKSRMISYDSQFRVEEVGFAYDSNSNDYKVLMCLKSEMPEDISWATVLYSCKTNEWQIIANPPWGWDSVKFPGVAVSNSLNWMDRGFKQIRCFDNVTQRYSQIPLPRKVGPGYEPTVTVLREQLCLVTYYFDIWILKEYGVEESWTKLFHCPSTEWNNLYNSQSLIYGAKNFSLLCSEDGCKILLAIVGAPHREAKFILCDMKSLQVRKIDISGAPSNYISIKPWVPSLAALSD